MTNVPQRWPSAVQEVRRRRKESFKARHGVSLGLSSFFVRATVAALDAFPRLNAEIQGEEIVLKKYYDIGIAVGTSVNYLDTHLMKHYFEFRSADRPALDMARFAREGRQPENSFYRRLGDMLASVPAKLLKLAGPAFVMDTACAASSHAIGEAFRLVRLGKVKAMLAGGRAS